MKKTTNIIIGAGKLGSSMAKKLYEDGESVTVIDRHEESLSNLEDYCGFFDCADATDMDVLQRNDITHAKSVIIATNDDDANIYLARVCNGIFGVENIIVRLADSRKAKLCAFGNVKCICPFELSFKNFEEVYKENSK